MMKAFLLTEDQDISADKRIAKKNAKVIQRSKFVTELYKQDSAEEAVWVTDHREIIESALRDHNIFEMQENLKKKVSVLILDEENFSLGNTLSFLFKKAFVFAENKGLSVQEALEVLSADAPSNFVIGGVVNFDLRTLSLTRGNLSTLVVPWEVFRASGDGVLPEFSEFSVIDGGQTLKFGKYEASVESVLYEYDVDYRKQINAQRARSEKTLAACLKRARVQKGLLQSDFPGIDERVIGRIERGEVLKPHSSTMRKIAGVLGIRPEDLLTY